MNQNYVYSLQVANRKPLSVLITGDPLGVIRALVSVRR